MITAKINWGTRIAILYIGFVILIATLVYRSMHQRFDLVSSDYYDKEVKYQETINASQNQSSLSSGIIIQKDSKEIRLAFPPEFKDKSISGTIQFYSDVRADWDKVLPIITIDNTMKVPISWMHKTIYKVKVNWQCEDKKYYQETVVNLSK